MSRLKRKQDLNEEVARVQRLPAGFSALAPGYRSAPLRTALRSCSRMTHSQRRELGSQLQESLSAARNGAGCLLPTDQFKN